MTEEKISAFAWKVGGASTITLFDPVWGDDAAKHDALMDDLTDLFTGLLGPTHSVARVKVASSHPQAVPDCLLYVLQCGQHYGYLAVQASARASPEDKHVKHFPLM
ncbi:hypothetical protein H9P43_008641 [Blastocladiella emersonii ATCC 22665]|nr:hypothetical protein H9P43_008641 [Blastocladiella emersonii ATCC 22665]